VRKSLFGDELSLHSTAISKKERGESCYASPISELGKQITVITVTVIISSLKTNKQTKHFLEWRKTERKQERKQRELSQSKFFEISL